MINAELAERCQKFGAATIEADVVNQLNGVGAGTHEVVTG
jgi:hypothetical protein